MKLFLVGILSLGNLAWGTTIGELKGPYAAKSMSGGVSYDCQLPDHAKTVKVTLNAADLRMEAMFTDEFLATPPLSLKLRGQATETVVSTGVTYYSLSSGDAPGGYTVTLNLRNQGQTARLTFTAGGKEFICQTH